MLKYCNLGFNTLKFKKTFVINYSLKILLAWEYLRHFIIYLFPLSLKETRQCNSVSYNITFVALTAETPSEDLL